MPRIGNAQLADADPSSRSVEKLLGRAEGAEPTKIGAASPQQNQNHRSTPKYEDKWFLKERRPAELRCQSVGERQYIDD